jgi:DNA-binding transcriptional ArsR family regulator
MPAVPDQPGSPEDPAPRRLDNPRSIRALAHPARVAIINALATGEELTATQCAALTGLSPSATAYHLSFLERYGFAETAPLRPDRRERPWRATERRTQVDLDGSTPAGASAAAAVAAAYFDTTRAIGVEFTEGEHAEPEEWRGAALSNADLWLTVEELHQVAEELEAVLEPYRERAGRGERPVGSRRVRVMNVVVPHRRPHPESGSGEP